jgi:hypothetical protein
MARPRQPRQKKQAELTKEQLIYLAAVLESQLTGLKGTNDVLAAAVDRKEDWPKAMAATYGGEAREWTSEKSGKKFWGWFVPVKRRYQLVQMIEAAGVTIGTAPTTFDGIRGKLLKAIPLDQREDLT